MSSKMIILGRYNCYRYLTCIILYSLKNKSCTYWTLNVAQRRVKKSTFKEFPVCKSFLRISPKRKHHLWNIISLLNWFTNRGKRPFSMLILVTEWGWAARRCCKVFTGPILSLQKKNRWTNLLSLQPPCTKPEPTTEIPLRLGDAMWFLLTNAVVLPSALDALWQELKNFLKEKKKVRHLL